MQDVFFANSSTLIVSAGAVVPTLALALGLLLDRVHRARAEKPPQAVKLLRPPGYSHSRKLDGISDTLLETWLFATASCVVAVIVTNLEASSWGKGASFWYSILNSTIAVVATVAACFFFFRVARLVPQARSCRLKLRGEQLVGQALTEVVDYGYRTFHDLSSGSQWKADHVVVGPQGVFLIDTITRNRGGRRQAHPAHEVHVNKNTLYFPKATDSRSILQADSSAKWLADYLEKKTGTAVPVTPMVVLPGWCVLYKAPPSTGVEVLNPQFMIDYLRNQTDTLSDDQLQGIMIALDEKCRDIDF
jgi:hypothetical protein